jgi:uncharacterized protein (TIGR02145 family)
MITKTLKLLTATFASLISVSACFSQAGKTVKIGNQEWMTENLNVSIFRNGDALPEAKTAKEWEDAGKKGEPVWCYYENDPANGKRYGKLYNWYAINDSRRITPEGWHVPTVSEWQTLIDYYGGDNLAGGKMKETGTVHWKSPNSGATNENGFSALPGGQRDGGGEFFDMGYYATFWSATDGGAISAWGRHLSRGDTKVYHNCVSKNFGFSVRYVRD